MKKNGRHGVILTNRARLWTGCATSLFRNMTIWRRFNRCVRMQGIHPTTLPVEGRPSYEAALAGCAHIGECNRGTLHPDKLEGVGVSLATVI